MGTIRYELVREAIVTGRWRWRWLVGALIGVLAVAVAAPFIVGTFYSQLETWGSEPAPTQQPGVPGNANLAWPATVTYVHDGDTVFLQPDDGGDELKVRLIGIDTPEVGDERECFGDEAPEMLRSLLPEGAAVWALADREELDRYGRSLLYLYGADGSFVNLTMVEKGAAEAVVFGQNDLYADQLFAAEDEARAAGLGMWGVC